MKTVVKENANGGKGQVVVKYILDDNELNAKCKMFAEVTIAPGCSLGYHEHHGESENIKPARHHIFDLHPFHRADQYFITEF